MLQTRIPYAMEAYAARQEHFIRLFISLSQHFADIKEDKDLVARVKDICATFCTEKGNEYDWDKKDSEQIGVVYQNLFHDQLKQRLVNDAPVAQGITKARYARIRQLIGQDDVPQDYQKELLSLNDAEFKKNIDTRFENEEPEFTCDTIAFAVCEAHTYFASKNGAAKENTH